VGTVKKKKETGLTEGCHKGPEGRGASAQVIGNTSEVEKKRLLEKRERGPRGSPPIQVGALLKILKLTPYADF